MDTEKVPMTEQNPITINDEEERLIKENEDKYLRWYYKNVLKITKWEVEFQPTDLTWITPLNNNNNNNFQISRPTQRPLITTTTNVTSSNTNNTFITSLQRMNQQQQEKKRQQLTTTTINAPIVPSPLKSIAVLTGSPSMKFQKTTNNNNEQQSSSDPTKARRLTTNERQQWFQWLKDIDRQFTNSPFEMIQYNNDSNITNNNNDTGGSTTDDKQLKSISISQLFFLNEKIQQLFHQHPFIVDKSSLVNQPQSPWMYFFKDPFKVVCKKISIATNQNEPMNLFVFNQKEPMTFDPLNEMNIHQQYILLSIVPQQSSMNFYSSRIEMFIGFSLLNSLIHYILKNKERNVYLSSSIPKDMYIIEGDASIRMAHFEERTYQRTRYTQSGIQYFFGHHC